MLSKLFCHSSHQHGSSFPAWNSGAESRYLFLQERAHYSPHGQPSQASPQHVRPRYSGLHHSNLRHRLCKKVNSQPIFKIWHLINHINFGDKTSDSILSTHFPPFFIMEDYCMNLEDESERYYLLPFRCLSVNSIVNACALRFYAIVITFFLGLSSSLIHALIKI